MYNPKSIGERIRTQDNAITDQPIFMVQEKKRVYGVDGSYTDRFVWVSSDPYQEVVEADEKTADKLELAHWDGVGKNPTAGWDRVGYIDIWINVQPFFTRWAAQEFIDGYGYNFNEPRIFVESGYRNWEWEEARRLFMSIE